MTELDILRIEHKLLGEVGGWIESDKHEVNTQTLNYIAGVVDAIHEVLQTLDKKKKEAEG